MTKMLLNEVTNATENNIYFMYNYNPQVEVNNYTLDSRHVNEGSCFIATQGEHVDGFDFVISAIELGATCCVLEKEPTDHMIMVADEHGVPLLMTESIVTFLAELASYVVDKLRVPVISVTGSSGKTTTKEYLVSCLSKKFKVSYTHGNHNNHLGMPLEILNSDNDTELFVLEMGMNAPNEIAHLASIAKPNIGVITNIGTSHVGMLGSRENIAKAKCELLSGLSSFTNLDLKPLAVLPAHDDFIDFMRQKVPTFAQMRTFGESPADVSITDAQVTSEGFARGTITFFDGATQKLTLSHMGLYNLYNAAAAAAVAEYLGVNKHDIVEALAQTKPTESRGTKIVSHLGFTIIDDSYNANPDSMRASIEAFNSIEVEGNRILCLGEMGELGNDEISARMHKELGEFIANKSSTNILVTVGSLAKYIAEGVESAGNKTIETHSVQTHQEALKILKNIVTPRDAILCKASRVAQLEKIIKVMSTW